ncbi:MAG: glycoside hydrolase [Actinomycetota bacterium]|nr:glycoside hydrolase [Actinomycetota bacterium]
MTRPTRRAVTAIAASMVIGATLLATTTAMMPAPSVPPPARGPSAPGEDEVDEIAERIAAYDNAEIAGQVGRTSSVTRSPTTGWAGARIVHPRKNDWEPAVAADPNDPWVYIMAARYGSPLCADCPEPWMMLERSRDGGKTWSKARPVCRCKGTPWQADPIIEVAPDTGSVYAIWMDTWNVVFSRSDDHGRTWTDPVSTKGTTPWNDKPALVVSDDGQDVWVTWNGPSGGDPFVARSNDGGATWRRRRVVSSDRYYFAYDGDVTSDGTVVLAQSSISYSGPGGTPRGVVKHHALVSDDGGNTWQNIVVGTVRIGVPCVSVACPSDYYIGHSSVAADDDGGLFFVYDGAVRSGARQRTFVSTSFDNGLTWSVPIKLSEPHEQSGFPMVAATGSGDVRVWYMQTRNGHRNAWNVWYRASGDAGVSWTDPARLSNVTGGFAYITRRGFREPYGDYGEIAITSSGKTIAVWGEGMSYWGPGGVWFNRQR